MIWAVTVKEVYMRPDCIYTYYLRDVFRSFQVLLQVHWSLLIYILLDLIGYIEANCIKYVNHLSQDCHLFSTYTMSRSWRLLLVLTLCIHFQMISRLCTNLIPQKLTKIFKIHSPIYYHYNKLSLVVTHNAHYLFNKQLSYSQSCHNYHYIKCQLQYLDGNWILLLY